MIGTVYFTDPIYKRCLALVDKEGRTEYEQQRQTRMLIRWIDRVSVIMNKDSLDILKMLENVVPAFNSFDDRYRPPSQEIQTL